MRIRERRRLLLDFILRWWWWFMLCEDADARDSLIEYAIKTADPIPSDILEVGIRELRVDPCNRPANLWPMLFDLCESIAGRSFRR